MTDTTNRLGIHPLCALFPKYSDEDLSMLKASIEQNGLTEPLVLLDGQILDGQNRDNACYELGIVPKTVNFEDLNFSGTPVDYVLAKNLRRRHLDESQRAAVALQLANLPPHRPTKDDKSASMRTYSQEEAATAMGVSRRLVQNAKTLQERAPEAFEKVRRGEVKIGTALKDEGLVSSAKSSTAQSGGNNSSSDKSAANNATRASEVYKDFHQLYLDGQYDGTKLRNALSALQRAVEDMGFIESIYSELVTMGDAWHNLHTAVEMLSKYQDVPLDTLIKHRDIKHNKFQAAQKKLFDINDFMWEFAETVNGLRPSCQNTDEQELLSNIELKYQEMYNRVSETIAHFANTTQLKVLTCTMMGLPVEWHIPPARTAQTQQMQQPPEQQPPVQQAQDQQMQPAPVQPTIAVD